MSAEKERKRIRRAQAKAIKFLDYIVNAYVPFGPNWRRMDKAIETLRRSTKADK